MGPIRQNGRKREDSQYVLAEVWLAGEHGFLVHVTKGAH
jgi:hypothetical protein